LITEIQELNSKNNDHTKYIEKLLEEIEIKNKKIETHDLSEALLKNKINTLNESKNNLKNILDSKTSLEIEANKVMKTLKLPKDDLNQKNDQTDNLSND